MISIVIPTCNRADMLSDCIDKFSYSVQQLNKDAYEVIITDDSSDDKTRLLLEEKYPDIRYVKGPRKGPASNRNNGAGFASGEWIMFIDDDCIPSDKIVKSYLDAIGQNPGIEVFEGLIDADRPKKHLLEESPLNLTGGYMWSCNIMLSKNVFKSLGGFDENFPFAAMEDVDLRVRVQKINKKFVFVKDASVIHPWRFQDKLIQMTEKRGKSEDYFYKKHPELLHNKYTFRNDLRFLYKLLKAGFSYGFSGASTVIRAYNLDKNIFRKRLKDMNR